MKKAGMRSLSLLKAVRIFFLFAFLGAALQAVSEGADYSLSFQKDNPTIVATGNLIRGNVDKYILETEAEQSISIGITSLEDNAVFQLYEDNTQKWMVGADQFDDAVRWAGKLSAHTKYIIAVGGTRGNAAYTLEIHRKD